MTIPIYDKATLPCIQYPFVVRQEESKRFLGGRAITGATFLELNFLSKSDAEENALYNFWKTGCNYGLEPFLIALPIHGASVDEAHPDVLVQWVDDFTDTKEKGRWTTKRRVRVIGTIDYTIDEFGNFIVTDLGEYTVSPSGDYVPTGSIATIFREVLYGN